MAEATYLSEGDVLITDARIVIGPTTHVLQNVTSVRAVQMPRPDGPGGTLVWLTLLACGIAGLLALANTAWLAAIPVLLTAGLTLAWWMTPKHRYAVVLGAAGGETTAFVSPDGAFVQRIVDAVNRAVIDIAAAAKAAAAAKGAAEPNAAPVADAPVI